LAALYNSTALGLLRYALIFVAFFPPVMSAKIVRWMNKFFIPSKLHQLFYFSAKKMMGLGAISFDKAFRRLGQKVFLFILFNFAFSFG
jgi:hypothetical protein